MIFKQRKNKQFNYKTRFNEDGELKKDTASKFDFNWVEESKARQKRTSKLFSLPFLILFLIMIVVLWVLLGRYE
ncbi:hypothetical protein [Mangrovimonas spongiae]|uniref:Uncharacterized protein n=1 Tax=Mangrovimonas spongiae TaxID=2494697 RepID=A0A3R9MRY2_9FLAO|nr:hypothetical protein [Mangrovimonas spongiae]RSK39243.1 hypothetical protein EJA19_09935 [Mangrovimonas spongiae]